jgi:hypothetical protein
MVNIYQILLLLSLIFKRESLSQEHCLHLRWNIAFQLAEKFFISNSWTECYLKIHSSWVNWSTERIPKKEYSLGIYHLILIGINFCLLQEFVLEFCSSETEKEVLIAMFDSAILLPYPNCLTGWIDRRRWPHSCWHAEDWWDEKSWYYSILFHHFMH